MRAVVALMIACSGDDVVEQTVDETGQVTPDDTGSPTDPTEPEVVTFVVSPDPGELGVRAPVTVVFDAPMDPSTLELGGTLLTSMAVDFTWSASDGNDPARLELAPQTTWSASAAHSLALTVDSAAGTAVEVDSIFAVSTQIAFVTAELGPGDLGAWSTAGGAQGREAGDAICAAEAQQAGLTGEFRALLNDGARDAACTLYGLEGQVTDTCGATVLPAPLTWQRPDGVPLGDSAQLVDGFLLHPLDTPLIGSGSVPGTWYGTRPLNCGDWTRGDADAQGRIHQPSDTRLKPANDVRPWNAPACDAQYALMCVQFAESVPLSPPETEGLRVFVTSASGPGDLGSWPEAGGASGIAAGDAICQDLAADGGLSNPLRFRALLSDPSTDAVDRFPATGPWVRADGALLGQTFAELLTPATSRPLDESGSPIETDPLEWFHRVWTGTDSSDGRANGNDQCVAWTDGTSGAFTAFGNFAMAGSLGTTWPGNIACENDAHLYCVETPGGRY